MFDIHLTDFEPKVRKEKGKLFIWGQIRKKYLILTPEEWVRQALIFYLYAKYNYPKNLMQIERSLQYHHLQKRSDIIVLDKIGDAFLLVECKAPNISLSENVWMQALTYNKIIKAKYVLLTNGNQVVSLFLNEENGNVEELDEIPAYPNQMEL